MKSTRQTARRALPLSVQIRTLHAYVGMLIAPTVIFFASTGILQIYSLHEAHPGYTPAPLIEKLSAIHKDQRFAAGRKERPASRPAARPRNAAEAPRANEARGPKTATTVLKAFFTLVAISLIFSTLAGVWIALQHPMKNRTHLALLLVGIVVPVVLAALTA
jgi:hypothetical protein